MKTTNLKRINVTIPTQTLKKVDHITRRGERSWFINSAINFYVQEIGRRNLRNALKEGAEERFARDKDISAEWFNIDEELWVKKMK